MTKCFYVIKKIIQSENYFGLEIKEKKRKAKKKKIFYKLPSSFFFLYAISSIIFTLYSLYT